MGTDLAELLLRDHKTVWLPGKSPNEANLIDFTNEALEQVEEESGEAQLSFLTDSLVTAIDSLEKETERFRELLLYGRKKVNAYTIILFTYFSQILKPYTAVKIIFATGSAYISWHCTALIRKNVVPYSYKYNFGLYYSASI